MIASAALAVATPVAGARTIEGNAGPNHLHGTARADTLHGDGGPDRLTGLAGDDVLTGDTGPDVVDGGAGADTLLGAAGNDKLGGGSGDDIVDGGFGADVIVGGAGDDTLDGGNDDDVIFGGDGDDVIHGETGNDTLDGGAGNDTISTGSGGAGRVAAGPGDDVVVTVPGAQRDGMCGDGDDTLLLEVGDGGEAADPYRPADCEHVYTLHTSGNPNEGETYLAPASGGAHDGTDRDDILLGGVGGDVLRGGAGNDVLWGLRHVVASSAPPPDALDGGTGNDTIYGGPGPQRISGGPGDDVIEGGLGANRIDGGSGDDRIRLRSRRAAVVVHGGSGNDQIVATGSVNAHVACGPGIDRVIRGTRTRVARDCEHVTGGRRGRAPRDAAPTSYAAAVRATPGLIDFWRLDDPARGADQAGGDDVGPFTGSVDGPTDDGATAWAGGGPLTARDPTATAADAMTFEAIVDLPSAATGTIASLAGAGGDSITLVARGERAHVTGTAGGTPFDAGDLYVGSGAWHQIAVVVAPDGSDHDRLTFVEDGVTQTSVEIPSLDLTGLRPRLGGANGAIAMADAALYSRALSADELAAHVTAEPTRPAAVSATVAVDDATSTATATITAPPGEVLLCRIGDGTVTDNSPLFSCPRGRSTYVRPTGAYVLSVFASARFGGGYARAQAGWVVHLDELQATEVEQQIASDPDITGLSLQGAAGEPAYVTFGVVDGQRTECSIQYRGAPGTWQPCTAPLRVPATLPSGRALARIMVRQRSADATTGPERTIYQAHRQQALPDLAGELVVLHGAPGSSLGLRCSIDGRPADTCPSTATMPPGRHTVAVTTSVFRRPFALPTLTYDVPTRAVHGTILATDAPAALEHSTTLRRRGARIGVTLTSPALLTVQLRRADGAPVLTVPARGVTGENSIPLPGRALTQLKPGRYRLVLTAGDGTPTVRQLDLAIVAARH